MSRDQYDLIKEETKSPRPPQRRSKRTAWIVASVALLVLAAVLLPFAWRTQSYAAVNAEAQYIEVPTSLANSSLLTDQEALADLYDAVASSVVNIQVTSQVDTAALPNMPSIPGFGSPDGQAPTLQSQGSGFIYDAAGHIVTNNHVVEGAQSVLVVFHDGHWADAEVVATDPQADLAVIKVTPPEGMVWNPLEVDSQNNLRVGNTVVAIGNPFGLDGTMTTGIVSALGRGIPVGEGSETRYTLPDVIQTDAAINPGNSGGPLIDLDGQVVGVNFAIRSAAGSNAGVGFAIPAAVVNRVVPALIQDGAYNYAYLGLSGSTISSEMSKLLGLPDNVLGVYVAEVIPGGPADKAGLQGGSSTVEADNGAQFRSGGDIVTAIDGTPVQRFEDLVSYLVTQAAPGQSVTLSVLRDGKSQDISVTLGERPSQAAASQPGDTSGEISAREAIAIGVKAAEDSGLLSGPITEKVATPDEQDGVQVWVVELSTGSQTATVTVDAATGEVLTFTVE